MPLYELTGDGFGLIEHASYKELGLREREDLQRLLKDQIEIIDPDLLVLRDEFDEWDESRRRIDLLCVDSSGQLVVIEIKRTETGNHMELQALRYAAMVSKMTLDESSRIYGRTWGVSADQARETIVDHLSETENPEHDFACRTRVVLVSADFSKELTTSVLWLNEHQLDIRCVRLRPHELDGRRLIQTEQIIPIPEAESYQISLRAKASERRAAMDTGKWTGAWIVNIGEHRHDGRSWEDSRTYGYISAGGTPKHQRDIQKPSTDEIVCAYITGYGYAGVGRVLGPAVPIGDFRPEGTGARLLDLPLRNPPTKPSSIEHPDTREWCLPVDWLAAVDRDRAIRQDLFRRGTVAKLRKPGDAEAIVRAFDLDPATLINA